MLILAAKFLVIVGLPIAAALIWQRHTRAAWSCVFFAFAAFVFNYVATWTPGYTLSGYTPLSRSVISLVSPSLADSIWAQYLGWPSLMVNGLFYGLISVGVRWLLLRFLAVTVRSWEEGILFGLGYSVAIILARHGREVLRQYRIKNIVAPPHTSDDMIVILNDAYQWDSTLFAVSHWMITTVPFAVGISLAVLFSVRRRQIWLFLAAILLYIMGTAVQGKAQEAVREVRTIIYPVLVWVGIPGPWLSPAALLLMFCLASLPALWLTFRLRSSWMTLDCQEEDKEMEKLIRPAFLNVVTIAALLFTLSQLLSMGPDSMTPAMNRIIYFHREAGESLNLQLTAELEQLTAELEQLTAELEQRQWITSIVMATTAIAILASVIANYIDRQQQRVTIGRIRRLEADLHRLKTRSP